MFCVIFVYQTFVFLPETNAQGQPSLDKIFEIWKQRQDSTRTFDFQWEDVRMYAKGSMPVFKGEAQPSMDIMQNGRMSIQVDGDRMRVWSNMPPWNPQSGKFVPREHLSVFDGEDEKVFYDKADPGVQATVTNKAGIIGIYQYNQDVVDYHLWPLLLTYRPLYQHMGRLKKNEWEMTGERGVVGERDCLILRKKKPLTTEKCWVDFERDCIIARYEYITNFRFQIDISYEDTHGLGWLPASWKTTHHLPEGTLQESSRSKITGYTINRPLPEEWFHFEFPVGTDVTDHKSKIEYIVREGGHKRLVTEEERMRSATYEQLLATESGQAGLPSRSRTTWWVVLALSFAGIVLLSVIVRRKRRREES